MFLFDEIDSTNLVAKKHALKNMQKPKLFLANKQLNGKGRLGRKWLSSSKDGLYMSVLFNTTIPSSNIPFISLIAGISICRAINKFVNNKAQIKWPNDIIINNKKVCGILLESIVYNLYLSSVVLGVGINLNNKDFESQISHKATSLFLETGELVNKKDIVLEILDIFSEYYNLFLFSDFDNIRKEYKSLCVTLNRDVVVKKDGLDIKAFCVDIDNSGNLIAQTRDSKRLKINSGEVVVQGIC